jgi:hypothetical protein
MNIFGIEILSKEEKEKRRQDYIHQIFPFGEDTQKKLVTKLLREVCPTSKSRDEELLFVFISGKDSYLKGQPGPGGLDYIFSKNSIRKWLPQEDLRMVVALIYLERDITDLEAYPTADEVRAAAQDFPVKGYFEE